MPVVLLRNKCDLSYDKVVSYEIAGGFTDETAWLYCFEVSAKEGGSIELAIGTFVGTDLAK